MTYISGMRRKRAETVNIVVRGIGRARPQRRREDEKRGKSPGSAAHHFTTANASKYGLKGAASRQRIPKFADAYELALLQEVPAPLRKQLKLRKGTTMMDLLVTRVVEEAALQASTPHVTEVREVIEGKVANKNLNISAELETYLNNPAFQQFMLNRLDEFRAQHRLPEGE